MFHPARVLAAVARHLADQLDGRPARLRLLQEAITRAEQAPVPGPAGWELIGYTETGVPLWYAPAPAEPEPGPGR